MKIAFVAPFYGESAAGGAESECRHTAINLSCQGIDVEVLTTCLLDLNHDWNVNYYKEGLYSEDGVTVRRFRAEQIDRFAFARLDSRLKDSGSLNPDEESQLAALFINSFGLYRYLADNADQYDWLCFIPYLFGTSHFGARICPDKSILIPCLHDEPYAHMRMTAHLFERVRRVVFHTKSEQALAERLYGSAARKGVVIGEGVDTDIECVPERFRQKYAIGDPFLLYAGRKDQSKNTPLLLDYFAHYKKRNGGALKLLLIGPGGVDIPGELREDIVDLGYIPLQDKYDAYKAASALCQPSLNESFSLVIMEAWLCGTPCIVHGDCAVTREHVVRSGGGLYFQSFTDFEGELNYMLRNADLLSKMEASGKNYVLNNYAWKHIMINYLSLVLNDT